MLNLDVTCDHQITINFIFEHIYTADINTIVTYFIPVIVCRMRLALSV